MRRSNGEMFWCQVSGRSLDHDHPSRDGIWIFQDIDERKKVEEALQRANERLESRVQERTADLRRAYEALREEMTTLANVVSIHSILPLASGQAEGAEVTLLALERFGLLPHLDLVVSRDDMREMKPDPDGYRVITAHFGPARDAVVVGDSWVDGVAAAGAGVPFVAYRAKDADLTRWRVTPVARLQDLGALPTWLRERPAQA